MPCWLAPFAVRLVWFRSAASAGRGCIWPARAAHPPEVACSTSGSSCSPLPVLYAPGSRLSRMWLGHAPTGRAKVKAESPKHSCPATSGNPRSDLGGHVQRGGEKQVAGPLRPATDAVLLSYWTSKVRVLARLSLRYMSTLYCPVGQALS